MFGKDLEHNVRVNIYNGIALAVATNLVNPYYAKFAQRLGASDYHLAFLNSWPAFVSIFALIPGALLIETLGRKQRTTTTLMLVHKLFFIALACIPWIQSVSRPWLFVLLVGFMNFPGSIYQTGYQSSIGDLFTPRERGTAMGLRNRYSDVFRLAVTMLSGVLLTQLPQNDAQVIALYQTFFFIAFAFGIMEVYSFSKFNTTSHVSAVKKVSLDAFYHTLLDGLKFISKSAEFKLFFICSLIFHFGWQMGWPLFNIYMLQTLGANEAWLSAVAIASGLSSIVTATHWIKFADRFGNTLTIVIATFGMSITPFLYVVSNSLIMLVVFNVIIGVSITGTVLVLFNMLLDVTPAENRTTIISIYNTLISLSATIAPVVGVAIKDATSLKFALVMVGLLRLSGCISFYIRKKIKNRLMTE